MTSQLLLIEPRGHTTRQFLHLKAHRLHLKSEIRSAMARRLAYSLWITPNEPAMDLLLRTLPSRPTQRDQRLLSFSGVPAEAHSLMHAHFRFVVCAAEGAHLLPISELIEVLGSENRADLFIGGMVMRATSAILLYRGNLEPITVPLRCFVARPRSAAPDLAQLAITDYGQTVRLGSYEASTDAILYELDEDYRIRAKKRRLDEDQSIGGAIRRLRLQKGLRQGDFPGVTAKEIARIEHGKVKTPHRDTLEAIAARTGVPVDQLITY